MPPEPDGIGIDVRLDGVAGWIRHETPGRVLRLAGPLAEAADVDALFRLSHQDLDAWWRDYDGHGAMVVVDGSRCIAYVDQARTVPLLYRKSGTGWILAQRLKDAEPDFSDIDPDQAAAYALSGITLGPATLFRSIRALGPGERVVLETGAPPRRDAYRTFEPYLRAALDGPDPTDALRDQHDRMMRRLIDSIGDRPVLVPLSAGYDSRFIASGLKAFGAERVICFAYGRPGNREAVASKAIAERLGYPWHFVRYDNRMVRDHLATPAAAEYWDHADSGTAMPFRQDHLALTTLIRSGVAPSDAVLINGQSGDFITGNHIPKPYLSDYAPGSSEERREILISAIIEKHYKHWRSLMQGPHRDRIEGMLTDLIAGFGGLPEDPGRDFGLYEAVEFRDRQAKYVVNGQRSYESLGLSWRLPLWDPSYMAFWEEAPLTAKANQNLYRRVLEQTDWGGVWHDIPLNRSTRHPPWLAALRLLGKAIHSFPGAGGKSAWHRSERRYLEYFMEPLCGYAAVPYRRVASDRREHYSCIGWQIEEALHHYGLDWRGDVST